MASPALNGAPSKEPNGSLLNVNNPGSASAKSSSGAKVTDGMRKTMGIAEDASQRRAPQPKAWTSNINPITQQPTTTPLLNGSVTPKTTSQKQVVPQEVLSSDPNANDRQIWALGHAMGVIGTITTKQGEIFSGVFAGAITEVNESAFLFKMVRRSSQLPKEGANGIEDCHGEFLGTGPDHSVVFSIGDIIDISIPNISTISNHTSLNGKITISISPNLTDACIGTTQSFRIDSDISGGLVLRERDLQRWEPPSSHDVDMSQESIGEWDQFAANERFGGKSDYHEDIYTTTIDRSGPLYRMRELEAERKVREIEGDSTINAHIREERGLDVGDDALDEEERYSGVRRNGQDYPPLQSNASTKYTPPARRPAVPKPAASGTLDPAIISAQIARPAEPKHTSDQHQSVNAADATDTSKDVVISQGVRGPVVEMSKLEQPVKLTLPMAPTKLDTQKSAVAATATENVEANLLDSFRQFANTEKMRVQDSRRNRQSADKAVKFNDLMKFAKNFKLITPVPVDLVPILAKDKSKQDEIVEKARRNAEALAGSGASGKLSVLTDQKSSRPLAAARWDEETTTSGNDHQNTKGRPSLPLQPALSSKDRSHAANVPNQPARTQQGLLSHRLADSHRLHKAGMQPVPNPLPIQDARQQPPMSGTSGSGLSSPHGPGVRSPTSTTSARFNVKASEFKPNPAASMFKPVTNASVASSPRTDVNTRSVSRAPTPSAFFGDRKLLPPAERPSILSHFDILKHLKQEAEHDPISKNWIANGGIKPAYRTPPTWNPVKDGDEFKSYKEMFDRARPTAPATQQHSSPVNPALAHQHQLPLHLQNGPQGIPQVQTPQQTQHQVHSQPQHYTNNHHHYDDHHMRPSASSSSAYPAPSPRMQNPNLVYPSPMNHPAPLAYGQPMQQYIMGPNGPQPAGFRQFSAGPQMMAAPGSHLAPMMVQQPSAGGYMAVPQPIAMPFNPQIAMYPGTAPQPYGIPSQPPSGYPSPGRGAPMMMHQGSHQGQPVYMTPSQYGQPIYAQQPPIHMTPMRGGFASPQPQYAQSPYPQHHYAQQAHRTPNNGYAQLPQVHPTHIVSQQIPPPVGPIEQSEEPK